MHTCEEFLLSPCLLLRSFIVCCLLLSIHFVAEEIPTLATVVPADEKSLVGVVAKDFRQSKSGPIITPNARIGISLFVIFDKV